MPRIDALAQRPMMIAEMMRVMNGVIALALLPGIEIPFSI